MKHLSADLALLSRSQDIRQVVRNIRKFIGLTPTGQEQLPQTETHLRHRLLTEQAGYKQPKSFHSKFVTDVPQILPTLSQNQDSQPQPTLPHLLSATPSLLMSPPLLQHLPPGLQKKRKAKKTAAELSFFGLQMPVCKAEPAAAPQLRGYLDHT